MDVCGSALWTCGSSKTLLYSLRVKCHWFYSFWKGQSQLEYRNYDCPSSQVLESYGILVAHWPSVFLIFLNWLTQVHLAWFFTVPDECRGVIAESSAFIIITWLEDREEIINIWCAVIGKKNYETWYSVHVCLDTGFFYNLIKDSQRHKMPNTILAAKTWIIHDMINTKVNKDISWSINQILEWQTRQQDSRPKKLYITGDMTSEFELQTSTQYIPLKP